MRSLVPALVLVALAGCNTHATSKPVDIDTPAAAFATCMNTGELVALDADLGVLTSSVIGDSPISLGAYNGQLLSVDTMGNRLTTFDASKLPVTPISTAALGQAPNQILVEADHAYVLNSADNNVQVLDLTTGKTVDQIVTGANTDPYSATFLNGKLYVVYLGSGNDEQAANRIAELDVTKPGKVTRSLHLDATLIPAMGGIARPSAVAGLGTRLYITLGNLDSSWSPAGPGFLAVVETRGANMTLAQSLQLPAGCRNPGRILPVEERLFISCTGGYDGRGGAEVVVLDASTLSVLKETVLNTCAPSASGCIAAQPGVLALMGETVLVGDMAAGRLFKLDPTGALTGMTATPNGIEVCGKSTSGYQMISDILVAR